MTSTSTYQGQLRTICVHLKSNQEVITDAPTDNNGKGEAFSPTDLVATALASCAVTVMGIKARDMDIDMTGTKAEITKTMASNPRRIAKVEINIIFPENNWDDKTKTILKNTGLNCPVAKSLHSDLEQVITFNF